MTINAGVWIDHHKAVVVRITDDGEDLLQVMADPDKPARFVADDKRERKKMIHLNKYFDEVIDCLRDADAILVLGPGEAKGEFTKRIEDQKLKGRIARVETVDKMTDREIAAHVRQLLGIGSQKAKSTKAPIT